MLFKQGFELFININVFKVLLLNKSQYQFTNSGTFNYCSRIENDPVIIFVQHLMCIC